MESSEIVHQASVYSLSLTYSDICRLAWLLEMLLSLQSVRSLQNDGAGCT